MFLPKFVSNIIPCFNLMPEPGLDHDIMSLTNFERNIKDHRLRSLYFMDGDPRTQGRSKTAAAVAAHSEGEPGF